MQCIFSAVCVSFVAMDLRLSHTFIYSMSRFPFRNPLLAGNVSVCLHSALNQSIKTGLTRCAMITKHKTSMQV